MEQLNYRYVRQRKVFQDIDKEIHSLENHLGSRLPSDYREFVGKFGFSTSRDRIRIPDPLEIGGAGTSSLDVFYGLGSSGDYTLTSVSDNFSDRLPRTFLPIASSPGGQILLALSGDDYGKVFWWASGGQFDLWREGLELLSPTFDAFVRSLYLETD